MSEELKQTLVVTRNGSLDTEWVRDLEANQRREALQHVRDLVIDHVLVIPAENIARGMRQLVATAFEHV